MSPTAFGHYTVIRSLGSGGMADVYLAHDPALDRQVAVKVPHREFIAGQGRARFAREARAAAALEHFAIVPIYDYSEQDGLPYMVMRCLTGGSLEQRITGRPLAPAQALGIMERIAAALDYAHSRGVIHRDVKSANILFDDHHNAYLSDFGIAWMATSSQTGRLTNTGEVRGTFDYISPEQAQGKQTLDGRSDLYSLAVVLYEMLTGDVPYRSDSVVSLAVMHISAPIPDIRARRPDLPPALQNVMARALAKRPEDRYPNGAALVADLRRVLSGGRSAAPAPRPAAGGARAVPPALWIVAAVAAVLLVGFFVLSRPDDGGASTGNGIAAGTTADRIADDDETTPSDDPTATAAVVPDEAGGGGLPGLNLDGEQIVPADDRSGGEVAISAPVEASEPFVPAQPDEIVFQSNRDGDYEIYIMEASGGEARQLTFNNDDDNYPRVSPDGQRIVFVSERDGNPEIYVMNRDGGEQTRLTTHQAVDGLPGWSPDGAEIIFTSSRDGVMDLFVMNDDGSNVRQITDSPEREGRMSWSVDGRLAYNASLEQYWQIYTADADGGNRQRITHSTYDEWSPEWSPDGQWILFHSERDSRTNPGIYLMRPDGSDGRLLHNGPNEEWGATWADGGRLILFTDAQPDGRDDLYQMSADGRDVRLLAQSGSYPSWAAGRPGSGAAADPALGEGHDDRYAPMGQPIEITVSATEAQTFTDLYPTAGDIVIIEVIGGEWRAGQSGQWPAVGGAGDPQVPSKASFPVPGRPVMTLVAGISIGTRGAGNRPEAVGDYLAYVAPVTGRLWLGPNDDGPADNDGALRVRITAQSASSSSAGGIAYAPAAPPAPLPLSDGELVRLSFGQRDHYTPAFAPDQSGVLASARMLNGWQVIELDPNGGGQRRQLTDTNDDHHSPAPSPDGAVFLAAGDRSSGDRNNIHLFDAGGRWLQQLTDQPGNNYQPRWLPDGASFLYSVDDDGTGSDEIYLATLDGRRQQLTDNNSFDGFATPSADGRWVTFYSGRDNDYEIYVMAIDGSGQRRLTTRPGRDAGPAFTPDGQWIVYESDRGGDYDLYAVSFDGRQTIQLTDGPGNDFSPVVSPDGRWVLFQSDRDGFMDVYRVRWEQ